jgi:tRNA pseudouridine55 synthase
MDGVLVVDKPGGLTSHDVVMLARRALGETRLGHTGTLDPLATGVLPLAVGRATRLVQFLMASGKVYEARIRFGLTTDTYDVTGQETTRSGATPGRAAVETALGTLTGEYLQAPPAYSAKKIGGRRAYELARSAQAVEPTPVMVTVGHIELVTFDDITATVRLTCSAGFYVRSFAHTLGALVGTGACLDALRRTRSGEFTLDQAVSVRTLQEAPADAVAAIIPMERLLPQMPMVTVTAEGRTRISHGRELDASHVLGPRPGGAAWVRLMGSDGALLAVGAGASRPGSLHPSVVLI